MFKKFIEFFGSLVLLVSLCFLLLKLLPGGPFDEETALHPVVKDNLIKKWGLQETTLVQLKNYLLSILQGDWGYSMIHPEKTVVQIIEQGLVHTLKLSSLAMILVLLGAFIISLCAVYFRGRWVETALDQLLIALLSLPSLFWGPLLIYLFCFYFNLLPVAFLSSPAHFILPVLTLSLRPLAVLSRILKNSLLENLHADYVRTAQAKGVGEFKILFRHVLRNSMIPYLSYAGNLIASLLSGSFLVEMLFAVPGLGTQFINSVSERDYTLVIGLTVFYGIILMSCNAVTEVLMFITDPRLRGET